MAQLSAPPGRIDRRPLLAILLLSIVLGLVGIDSGVPNREHAYPYNPDEWTAMQCLRAMDPGHFDFNPHYFAAPTLPIYIWGATFGVAHVLRLLRINGNERYYFEHPEDLARMLVLGRLWSVLFAAGTVWITYLLARRFGLSRPRSHFAALLMALHPSLVVHAHFMKVNPMVTFLMVAAILASDHWLRRGGARNAFLAGALTGLAISTKFSAVLLLPLLALVGTLRWWQGRGGRFPGLAQVAPRPRPLGSAVGETALAGLAALGVSVLGTPYALLDWHTFLEGFGIYGDQLLTTNAKTSSALPLFAALRHTLDVHLTASTPPLVVAALVGFWLMLRRLDPVRLVSLLFLGIFFAATLRAGHLATDSRFLPLFPFMVVLATLALFALIDWQRAAGWGAAAVVVVGMAFWTVTLLARFVGTMPQELASTWAREHLPPDASVCLVSKGVYWNPDFPLRELLQADNAGNYERQTRWRLTSGQTYAETAPAHPDIVFLTAWLPRSRVGMEWLDDPAYEVVASFPGKVRPFGRRLPVWIDFYDVDCWVLKRRQVAG